MSKKRVTVLSITGILIVATIISIGFNKLYKQDYSSLKEGAVRTNHKLYKNVQELVDDVDLIIIGEPINDITEDEAVVKYYTGLNSDPLRKSIESFWTLRNVKIHKVLKGEFTDKTIKVAETAAVIDGPSGKELILSSDYSIAQKGKKYILFLKIGSTGDYVLTAVNQSKFNIDGTDLKEKEKSEDPELLQFSNLKKEVLEKYSKDIK